MATRERRQGERRANGQHPLTFHAKTVWACWRIAWRAAEAYQRRANRVRNPQTVAICLAQRNAASRIAQRIKHGPRKARLR